MEPIGLRGGKFSQHPRRHDSGHVCPPASVNVPETPIKEAYFPAAVADVSRSPPYRLLKQQQAISRLCFQTFYFFLIAGLALLLQNCVIFLVSSPDLITCSRPPPPPWVHCRDQKLFEAAHQSATCSSAANLVCQVTRFELKKNLLLSYESYPAAFP